MFYKITFIIFRDKEQFNFSKAILSGSVVYNNFEPFPWER